MKNVYYIHLCDLYPSSPDLDVTRWLCRDCARKRHARPNTSFAVGGSEVCEECGAKQISFAIGSFVERKRRQRGTRTIVGKVVGVRGGCVAVDWCQPFRIGGDGWQRSALSFKAIKAASAETAERAARYAAQHADV